MNDRNVATPGTKGLFGKLVALALTLGVVAAAVAAVAGLTAILGARADAVAGPAPAPLTQVRAMTAERTDGFTVTRRFAGQIEPARTAALGFEVSGEITEILVDEGQRVAQGALLARLDTDLLDADRARLAASRKALEAQAELARLTTERQSALQSRGFAAAQALDNARLGLAEIEARLTEVDASIARLDVLDAQSELRAPFDGRVGDIAIDTGTVVAPGQTVLALLEDGPALFRVGLDPALADEVAGLGPTRLHIAGRVHDAEFAGFRPDLDPRTRTRTALFEVDGAGAAYLQSGTLEIETELAGRGYALPVSALQDGIRGLWTVLVLTPETDGTYRVATEAVEILHADETRAFVQGTLSDGALIVGDGVHRVVPGDRVTLAGAPG
ncbi:efflux RND transporter periplasmic adaptor subunit [Sulfitobacter sp. D35]|uniref:efflux RND transporter periplasmic adaptor subunit n=1 Tax=Sulfitobacter sp. D35 TaxID=3083252 RepID=UPI00296FA5E5|nr:efflux RND transporter periplasmic adaptor subunit [Sulfitobacter sp. D35]MDW4496969.1 efflux RND transporter periplasmic adaptor subunit [Sulfitobacter sp. D35]